MTRQELIAWLMWNDPNGVYSDHDSIAEFGEVITYKYALEIALRQIKG